MSEAKPRGVAEALQANPRATTRGISLEHINPNVQAPARPEEIPFFSGITEVLEGDTALQSGLEGVRREAPAADPREGLTSPPPPPIPSGAIEARPWLEDRGEFARGGMSRLKRTYQRTLRRVDAMKILDQKAVTDLAARLRFIEEAQITGQLDHPNIPPIYDFWVDSSGEVQFTMKLVDGTTLTQWLIDKPPAARNERDWEALLRILVRVCDALSFAHSRGVIHRDIKPENIMVGAYGQVYLMDWGCAHLLPDAPTRGISIQRRSGTTLDPPQCILGTPAYMAPEQAWAEVAEIDPRTDVYLMGATLFEVLCDAAPHAGETVVEAIKHAQKGALTHPQELIGEETWLPPELCRIALKALAPRKEDRYPSMEALRCDLESTLRVGGWFASQIFSDGELVVTHGDRADAAYIILAGTCEVFRVHEGERVVLQRLGPGDVFGETGLLTEQQTRTANVQAIGEVTATVITKEAFERAFDDTWIKPFVGALATRFRELDERFTEAQAEAGEQRRSSRFGADKEKERRRGLTGLWFKRPR